MTASLFRHALGAAFDTLPGAVRRFHDGDLPKRYTGQAEVIRGPHPIARMIARIMGFPPATPRAKVTVTVTGGPACETWIRDFDGRALRSALRPGGSGAVHERFGPVRIRLQLGAEETGLNLSVAGAWVFGLPLPRVLWPISESHETQTTDGAFAFDVSGSIPGLGLLIRYHGTLTPDPKSSSHQPF